MAASPGDSATSIAIVATGKGHSHHRCLAGQPARHRPHRRTMPSTPKAAAALFRSKASEIEAHAAPAGATRAWSAMTRLRGRRGPRPRPAPNPGEDQSSLRSSTKRLRGHPASLGPFQQRRGGRVEHKRKRCGRCECRDGPCFRGDDGDGCGHGGISGVGQESGGPAPTTRIDSTSLRFGIGFEPGRTPGPWGEDQTGKNRRAVRMATMAPPWIHRAR